MPSRDIPRAPQRARPCRAWACVVACAWLLVAGGARAELPHPGVYRGAQEVGRVIVAVDPGEQAVKVLLPDRPRPDGESQADAQSRGDSSACVAFGATYETPADSTLKDNYLLDGAFCRAEIDVARASVTLKIPSPPSGDTVVATNLAESRSYADIVRLPRQAYFYGAPDVSKRTAAYVVPGDYVAVLRKTADWLLVDFFGPTRETRGWIRREDLIASPWVAQSATTPHHSFAVACQPVDDGQPDPDLQRIVVEALEIRERESGRRTQIFYELASVGGGKCEDVVALEDANFDGHPDLVISAQSEPRSDVNNTETFYLFDPGRQRFDVHDGLSKLTQPTVDPVKREIRAGYRSGCCEHGADRYRFVGGRLVLIESEVEKCGLGADDPHLCDVTTRRLVHGAYVVTKTKRRVE
jgi:hypothetical protein